MLSKETVAIVVALITGITGVTTAFINRFDPSEPAAEATYEVTRKSYDGLVEDLDELQAQIDYMEKRVFKQCLRNMRTIKTFSAPSTTGDAVESYAPEDTLSPKKKRRRTKMPSFNKVQQVVPK